MMVPQSFKGSHSRGDISMFGVAFIGTVDFIREVGRGGLCLVYQDTLLQHSQPTGGMDSFFLVHEVLHEESGCW